jgi:hypothetical protein
MNFPTDFNGQIQLVLQHATGADILAVITRQQKFAGNRLADSTAALLSGAVDTTPGQVADAQAQVFALNMLIGDLCGEVSHRITEQEKQEAKRAKAAISNESSVAG